jgi:hypothetical protein
MVAALADFPQDLIDQHLESPPQLRLLPPSPRRPTAADYRRRRVVALGVATLLALFAWIAVRSALDRIGGGPLAATGATSAVPVSSRSWVVRPGDTLWSIASAVEPRSDVRPLVDQLAKETGGRPLYPGQVIAVP